MRIVIDGYNLLKSIEKSKRVTDHQINRFIIRLGRYAHKSGNKVVAIFDGGSDRYATREKQQGITIIYSGYKEHADDVIKRYLEEHQNTDTILVSTDRELDDHAAQLGIEHIDSSDFEQLMNQRLAGVAPIALSQDNELHKLTDDADMELDELMRLSTDNIPIKQEDKPAVERPRHKGKKLSKDERRLWGKLKKI